jgi:NAD(P)-dependent dehydrogenase (short-subunit alcohol dehydrogenase family)
MRGLSGKVALVTGGGAGIGKATARRLAEEGVSLALLDWSEDDLHKTVGEFTAKGVPCIGVQGHVASPETCEKIAAQARDQWGRLDILVANAGIRVFGPLLETTDEDWTKILAVNLRGVANSCVAAGKVMREAGNGGAMVLISSMNAEVGRGGMGAYDAAKAGVLSLGRTLAAELAEDNIRVNCVSPGYTITDYHIRRAEAQGRTADDLRQAQPGLFKRPAEPHEIASAVVFLASDDASYITATNLFVDGGRHST